MVLSCQEVANNLNYKLSSFIKLLNSLGYASCQEFDINSLKELRSKIETSHYKKKLLSKRIGFLISSIEIEVLEND